MENHRIEYYGECCHVDCFDPHDYHCLKRYFTVTDITTLQKIKVGVCNEWFRLEFQERLIKLGNFNTGKYDIYEYEKKTILKTICVDIIKGLNINCDIIDYIGRSNNYSPLNMPIAYKICDRPSIYAHISFDTAFCILGKRNTKNYDHDAFRELIESLSNHISSVIDYCLKYSKYKAQHTKAERIKKTMKNNITWFDYESDEFMSELNDFFISLLK